MSTEPKGLVNFTFVPEVTTIFASSTKHYIYATLVDKGYLMPGQWRQVAVPALPMPEFVAAREILSNDSRHIKLAPAVIIGYIPEKFKDDKTLQHFLTTEQLDIPQDIGLGSEDYPPHYLIQDTPASKRFFPQR